MKTLKTLKNRISRFTTDQQDMLKKIAENPVYQIPWSMEELYKTSLQLDYLKQALKDLETQNEEEVYNHFIKSTTSFLDQSYNVFESSSSTGHRDASIWKYQTMHEIRKDFRYFLEMATEK